MSKFDEMTSWEYRIAELEGSDLLFVGEILVEALTPPVILFGEGLKTLANGFIQALAEIGEAFQMAEDNERIKHARNVTPRERTTLYLDNPAKTG